MPTERRRKNSLAGGIELICITLIIGLVAFMVIVNNNKLKAQEQEYIAKEELLRQQIREQEERTDDLNEQKKYVKTDQYIEEVAREKLGLINPDEIQFREKED